jgi:hypothetical protein
MDIDHVFHVEMMSALLRSDAGNVHLALVDHGHMHVNVVRDWHVNDFFLHMRDMDVHVLLHVEVMGAFLLGDRRLMDNHLPHHWHWNVHWHMHDLFLLLRYVDVNNLFHMKVVGAFLLRDSWDVHVDFPHHGHWHIHELLNCLVHNSLLVLNNGHVHDFLLLVRHMDINNLLHVEMVSALLLLNRWYVNRLLNHHWHGNFHNLLNGTVLDPALWDDFRDLNNLMHVPHHDLWDFMNLLDGVHRGNLDDLVMDLASDVLMVLVVAILRLPVNLV